MQDAIDLPPHASSMIESMRDIGYSFPAAIADIVDNSISARARVVRINFLWNGGAPVLAVADDGEGMDADTLLEAMRPGSQSPRAERRDTDLGRFGLGLKTASFSQCRRLSVVSSTGDGTTTGYRWDLDYIAETNSWAVHPLSSDDIDALPFTELLDGRGTLVVWEKIDRLMDFTSRRAEDLFNDHFDEAREHLELVFHRFLEPMADEQNLRRLRIEMNGLALKAFNPFFPDSPARQVLLSEDLPVEGAYVRVQPYVLPHHSRVDKETYERYGGRDGFAHTQGFYVYRNRRLIDYGTWFRLAAKREISRLARVRIDIPNTLDHLWGIDVRKSRATPPGVIRDHLKRVIGRITDSAEKVYRQRGHRTVRNDAVSMWIRRQHHGEIHYEANTSHPVLSSLTSELDERQQRMLETYLRLLGENIPTEMIFADMSGDPSSLHSESDRDTEAMLQELITLVQSFRDAGFPDDLISDQLKTLKPYSAQPDQVDRALEEINERG